MLGFGRLSFAAWRYPGDIERRCMGQKKGIHPLTRLLVLLEGHSRLVCVPNSVTELSQRHLWSIPHDHLQVCS